MPILKKGDSGDKVRYVQEWLTLNGYGVAIDSSFGPATEYSVKKFQIGAKLPCDGKVDKATWDALEKPLQSAIRINPHPPESMADSVILTAERHLACSPREVGGENMGPWVRYYMRGAEGASYPWCAGFVSTCVLQAMSAYPKAKLDFRYQVSCDKLAKDARSRNALTSTPEAGGLFLVKGKAAGDYVHVGIVTRVISREVIETIEGNTNNDGSREGYAVMRRTRSSRDKDYIRIA